MYNNFLKLFTQLNWWHGGSVSKVGNIGFNGYIGTWVLRIYRRYIGGYFYMSIDILEIKKIL